MVARTYVSDLSDISLFESTTGISNYGGGGGAAAAGTDYAIEGTNAIDKQVNNDERGFMFDNGGDFTIGADDHFFIWVVVGTYGLADLRADRGIVVNIGDSNSDFMQFHVNGVDTLPLGGMIPYAVRFDNTTLAGLRTPFGSPSTTPNEIGCGANITAGAKFANLAADAARIGTGYDIEGGTSADPEAEFAGIASDDATAREGIFVATNGGYNLQGKLRIGASGAACEFLDLNTNIFFIDVLHALRDFTEIIIEHADSILTLTNVNFIGLDSGISKNLGNLEVITSAAVLTFENVGFIATGTTILGSGSTLLNGRWIGSGIVTANGATLAGCSLSDCEDQKIIDAQDETDYDNSPTTEGTFVGGTGFDVSDTIVMSDGSIITVDAESSNVVTEFTVDSSGAFRSADGVANTQVSTNDTGADFTLTPEIDNLADASALIWDTASDADPELDDMSFTKGVAATHAIELGTTSPLTINLNGWTVGGYNASNGEKDSTFHVLRTSDTVTINVVGGSGNFSYKSEGATVIVVTDPVTTLVTVTDSRDNTPIENARVLLEAKTGAGDLGFDDSVTITASGSTATVALNSHPYIVGNKVSIKGVTNDQDYNGIKTITAITANDFDYVLSGTPASPAVGTITCNGVVLEGLTDSNGEIQDVRSWSGAQPVKGVARKSTGSPFFKTGALDGEVDNTAGVSFAPALILDE